MTTQEVEVPVQKPSTPRQRLSSRAAAITGRGRIGLRLATLAAACAIVFVVGANANPGIRYGVVLSVVYAIAILGNNAVLGLLGEMNLSGAAFMALGAYVFCYATTKGMDTTIAVAFAVVVTTIAAAVIAVPTTRLQGIFTALATFTMAFAVPTFVIYLKDFTGGDEGIAAPYDWAPFGLALSGGTWQMLLVSLVVFGLLGAASLYMLNSRSGRAALIIGEAELAGKVNGFSPRITKVAIWTWAGGLQGIAGVLFALTLGYIGPTGFHFMLGIWILVGSVIAGPRSAWGALLGGLFVGVLPVQLQTIMPAAGTGILFGALLLLGLFAGGKGLAEWIERAGLQLMDRKSTRKAA